MWPAFIAATIADGLVGHWLPLWGDNHAAMAVGLLGLWLNVIGLIVIGRPLALVLRRRRPDLPVIVARDYAGTSTVGAIAIIVLSAGLIHHQTVVSDHNAREDAITRAQAYIGDRAPPEFRRNLQWVSTVAVQPGSLYRACVPSLDWRRTFCVIVDTGQPFARSVHFDGYEPNATWAAGVGS